MVPNLSIIFMITAIIIGVILPLALAIYLIAKKKFSISCFLLGMACFFLFASVLEGLVHYYILQLNGTTSAILTGNTILYGLYGAFMAGIFEEVGRFLMMKLFMKRNQEFKDGFIFGLGHGFIEAGLIIGISYLNSIIYSVLINSGNFDTMLSSLPESSRAALMNLKDTLTNTPSPMFLLGGIERVLAIIIHISFSIIVLYGVKTKRIQYLFIAILGHALVDFPAVLYQRGVISLVMIYAWLVLSVAILIFVILRLSKVYKKTTFDEIKLI